MTQPDNDHSKTFRWPRWPLHFSIQEMSPLLLIWTSLISIGLLAAGRFSPICAMVTGLGLTCVSAIAVSSRSVKAGHSLKRPGPGPRVDLVLIALLVLALPSRVNPYHWVLGGQDQGVYVNAATFYSHEGKTIFQDPFYANLTPAQKETYALQTFHQEGASFPHIEEATYQPGVYVISKKDALMTFQFFPMHPIWMSLSAAVSGRDNGVNSLLLFSLLSIWGLYSLTSLLSPRGKIAGRIIAALLIAHPLHSFFTKYPTTEVLILTWSSWGFFYLARYLKEPKSSRRNIWLVLSWGFFSCLFFTHISGFIYLPMFYFLALSIALREGGLWGEKQLSAYLVAVVLSYCTSAFYGFTFSRPYSHDVFYSYFAKWMGDQYGNGLLAIALIFICALLLINVFRKRLSRLATFADQWFAVALKISILIVMALSIYKSYQILFTPKYLGDDWLDLAFPIANRGWQAIYTANFFSMMLYLTPIGMLLFFVALIRMPLKDFVSKGALLFTLEACVLRLALEPTTHYHYYFARYLLSELLPCAFILISLYMAELWSRHRKATLAIVCFMVIIFCWQTSFQFKGREADGAIQTIRKIEQLTTEKDLIVVEDGVAYRYLKMPMRFYINRTSMNFFPELISWPDVIQRFQRVIFFSASDALSNKQGFTFLGQIPFEWTYFEHSQNLPKGLETSRSPLFAYDATAAFQSPSENPLGTSLIMPGWYHRTNFFPDNSWTNGDAVLYNVNTFVPPKRRTLALVTLGSNPLSHSPELLAPKVFLDEIELPFLRADGTTYLFKVPGTIKKFQNIRIRSNTFCPRSLGLGNDGRTLGVDVRYLEFR